MLTGERRSRYEGNGFPAMMARASPSNGRFPVYGGHGAPIHVSEVHSGKLASHYQDHTPFVNPTKWFSDGQHIASASYDNAVQILAATSGTRWRRYEGRADIVCTVVYLSMARDIAHPHFSPFLLDG